MHGQERSDRTRAGSNRGGDSRVRFNELLAFRGPNGLGQAVATAARREHTTSAEFLRRLVLGRLREIGVTLKPSAPATAEREVA